MKSKISFNKHGQWSLNKKEPNIKQQDAIALNYKNINKKNTAKIAQASISNKKDDRTTTEIIQSIKNKAHPQLSLPLESKKKLNKDWG